MPECENGSIAASVSSAEHWQPEWAGWALPDDARCSRYKALEDACHEQAFDNNTVIQCEAFVYQTGSSIVAEVSL